jgi:hypothetical protein
LEYWVRRV